MRRRTFLSGCGAVALAAVFEARVPVFPERGIGREARDSHRPGGPAGAGLATTLCISCSGGASVGWHEVYDPQADTWATLKALSGARDHVGCAAFEGRIHVIGGRFNTFEYNTGLHHVYLPDRDTWEDRSPLPTVRSGHGLVVYRDRLFAMGGEAGLIEHGQITQARVFGQMESYDPTSDTWMSHARC